RLQPRIACGVCSGLAVLPAIEFDDQSRVEAAEVHDILVDGNLLADAMTVELFPTHELPERLFGVCHTLAQAPCVISQHGVCGYPPSLPSRTRGEGVHRVCRKHPASTTYIYLSSTSIVLSQPRRSKFSAIHLSAVS